MRIKSRWHDKQKAKTLEEIAGALGFNAWRMAQTTVNKMYSDGFNFRSNDQILDVIAEFLAFIVQVADRLAYERMDEGERQRFVQALAGKLIETMEDNRVEEQGVGEYRGPFIELLNERLAAYAEFAFSSGEPGYQMLRYFGSCVDNTMGGENNRWVIEQVVDVEAPEVIKTLRKGMDDLLAQGWQKPDGAETGEQP